MDKILTTVSLDVGYQKGNPVVHKVSFEVNRGGMIALIGGNGAGKSTILKTITGQLEKLSGEICICDVSDRDLTEEAMAKKVSMVTTERIRPELMRCYEVVATGRYPYTGRLGILTEADQRAVREAIDMVGASDISDEDFLKVSDGQRQRIMLARAICQDTDILILDEPTSYLDVQYKLDILSVIKKLVKEKKKAVVMSIHELEFVPAMADLVIGIYDHSVYRIGTPAEILTGENLEVMYKMEKGSGDVMAEGLWHYAKALERLLWQK